MKKVSLALALVCMAGTAYAQSNQMPSGPTAPPAGTTTPGGTMGGLPPATTNTARPGALDSSNVTAAEAAARAKIESAGYSNVKGLTRNMDGTWSGRAVKDNVEVAVSVDAGNNVMMQR